MVRTIGIEKFRIYRIIYTLVGFRSVKPQANVQIFDPLCEVQSDKATVEITSPFNGVVRELLVKEGEVAKVGEGLCMIEVDQVSETVDSEPLVQDSSETSHLPPELDEPGSLPSYTESKDAGEMATEKRLHPMDPNNASSSTSDVQNLLAKPSVRHFARTKGVDLNILAPGSGVRGRVEKSDIEAYLARGVINPPATDVVIDLGRTRYNMWKAMTKVCFVSHLQHAKYLKCNFIIIEPGDSAFWVCTSCSASSSVHWLFSRYSTTLDLTAIHNILPILNAHIPAHFLPPPSAPRTPPMVSPNAIYPIPSVPPVPPSAHVTRLTYLPILMKTLSRAMLEWPLFRSSIPPPSSNDTKPTLTIRSHADISIALSTPTGLYTPTIQQTDTFSIYSLASRLKHLAHLGRQIPCELTPEEMPRRGGTVTVSNIGAIGAGEFAMPVLVPGGGVAIVAVGRARWMWDVERGDGSGERRLKVGVSWSADHRVVEGAELAAFVESWRGYVEVPERLIAESI